MIKKLLQTAFAKKLITAFLVITCTLSLYSPFMYPPKQAEAITVVETGLALVKQIWTALQTTLSAVSNKLMAAAMSALEMKEFTLDAIAWAMVDLTLQSMARSMTTWIKNGFEGDPAFVQDLGKYLTGVGDKIVSDTIWGSDLDFLCSPFKLNIRLALEFQYKQTRNLKTQTQCSLSTIINNTDAFFKGNFLEGGWNGWFQVASNPVNNPYGALMVSQAALTARIGNARLQEKQQLDWGKGMFSQKVCAESVASAPGECARYETVTPGTAIEAQLNETLASGEKRLHVADEINEMLSALFAQLAMKAFSGAGGLLGLTGGKDNSGDNYFDQIDSDTTKSGFADSSNNPIARAVGTEGEYIALQDQIRLLIESAATYKDTRYGTTNTCHTGNLSSTLQRRLADARGKIATGNQTMATLNSLLADYALITDSQTPNATLEALKLKYGYATLPETQNAILQVYMGLQTSGVIHDPQDTAYIKMQDLEDVQKSIDDFKREVDSDCNLLGGGGGGI
jgi:hypothetical protein